MKVKKKVLITFNVLMMFVFLALDFATFNSLMQFLQTAFRTQVSSSYTIFESINIAAYLHSNSLQGAMGISVLNLGLFTVIVLIIGNIIGIATIKEAEKTQ